MLRFKSHPPSDVLTLAQQMAFSGKEILPLSYATPVAPWFPLVYTAKDLTFLPPASYKVIHC